MPPKGDKTSDETKAKLRAIQLGRKHTDETKTRMSEMRKAENLPMERRIKIKEGTSGKNNGFYGREHTDETRERIRQAKLGSVASDNTKHKMSESQKLTKGKVMPNSMKEKLRAIHTGMRATIATRSKMAEAHQGAKSHLWKGGISFEPYCQKFNNNFRERVRTFFNHKCVECGKDQGVKKLHVHHVNYNKMVCCDTTPPLFVSLCTPCHTKTTHGDRDMWETHFVEVIEKQYNGRSYFTKEEYSSLISLSRTPQIYRPAIISR